MKYKLKSSSNKLSAILLSLLMVFSCINIDGIVNVSAEDLLPEATMTYSGDTGVSVDLSDTGVNKTGYIYNMKLNGSQAFCLDAGYHARKGQYARISTVTGSTRNRIWNFCLNNDSLSTYFGGSADSWSNGRRAVAQGMLWAYEEGVGEDSAAEIICKVWAKTDPDTLSNAGQYALGVAKSWWNTMKSYSSSGTLYIYSYGINDNQKLITSNSGNDVTYDSDRIKSTKSYSVTEKVGLSINKKDTETSKTLEGVKFDLYRDETKITTVTTDSNGVASYTFETTYSETASATATYCDNYDSLSIPNKKIIGDVDYTSKADAKADADGEALAKAKAAVAELTGKSHSYVAKEVGTRNYYYLKADTSYSKSVTGNGSISLDINNEVQRGSIEITKVDSELDSNAVDSTIFDANNDGAQGDATLEGATYGLYAAEDIIHPDGKTGMISYTTDVIHQLVCTKGTDLVVNNVQATKDALIATAKTDEEGKIKFEHLYSGKYYVKEIDPSQGYQLSDKVYDFNVTESDHTVKVVAKSSKVTEEVNKQAFDIFKGGHIAGTSNNAKPLEGVEFTVKLESDVQRMGWENAPTYDVLTTDENGQASSYELPYGKYRVKETKSAVDYDTADDFFVTVTEDSRTHQSYTNNVVIDEEFKALIKAVKVDMESGKTVLLPKAEFKIKALTDCYVDGVKFNAGDYIGYWNWNILDGFYTDSWKTNDQGYVLINEKLGVGEYQLEEIHAPYGYVLNEEPVKFKVTNQGMYQLAEDGKTPIITAEKSDMPEKGQITLEKRGEVLTGYDEETNQFIYEEKGLAGAEYGIYAKEDIMDPCNDGTVLYAKDSLVEKITTDETGKAVSSKLYLGEYYSKEIKAPYGYTLSDDVKEFSLEYDNENVEVVFEQDTYTNDRQKVSLVASKSDADTNEPLAGMEATIYANRDVYNYAGELIVEEGTTLQSVTTDEDGKAKFTIDLPIDLSDENTALFAVKETKVPNGYVPTDKVIDVDTKYTNQNEAVLELKADFQNDITVTEISKVDATNGEQLPDAHLQIIDPETNEVVEETVTTDEVWVVKGLIYGKEYILKETIAPLGYAVSSEVRFNVGSDEKVEMKDELLTKFSKQNVGGEEIPGATIVVMDEEGKVIDEWISTETPHEITGLVNGMTYTMHEEVAAEGYVKATDIEFVARADENNHIVMIDKQVSISKTDLVDGTPVEGAELTITDKETGEIIDKTTTDNDVWNPDNLEEGKTYILTEVTAPEGYETAESVEFTVTGSDENGIKVDQKIEMKDAPILTDIQVNKVDAATMKAIVSKDFEFTMYADDKCTHELTTVNADTKDGTATFKDVRYGTYYIKETKAPLGYMLSDEVKKVVINDDTEGVGDIYSFIYTNTLEPVEVIRTSDDTQMAAISLMSLLSLGGIMLLKGKKRKTDND